MTGGLALLLWSVTLAAPGSAVYPPQTTPITFDHGRHASMPCTDCHTAAATSARAADALRPSETVCTGCHIEEGPTPHATACSGCHPGYAPETRLTPDADGQQRALPPPPPVIAPPAALRFSHAVHARRGVACATCHRDDGAGGRRLPDKATCSGCHDGSTATGRCDACHLADQRGLLMTTLPGGTLIPGAQMSRIDHRGDFARAHGAAAKAAPETCETCHTPRTCTGCHGGGVRPLEIHPADYLLTHAVPARQAPAECGQCHRLQTFCVDCHTRSGVTPPPGGLAYGLNGLANGRRYHPEGWNDAFGGVPGPEHHGFEARRNLDTCVSCHQEESCVRCHSVDSPVPQRASPHPPGFRRHCGTLERANATGCLKCHQDRSALDRLCR